MVEGVGRANVPTTAERQTNKVWGKGKHYEFPRTSYNFVGKLSAHCYIERSQAQFLAEKRTKRL
jgi:hypothetical protein